MHVTRPLTINEPTWNFLVSTLRRISQAARRALLKRLGFAQPKSLMASDCLPLIAQRPAPFLAEAGIFARSDLLSFTVITDGQGVEYIITPEAAQQITEERPEVALERLYDHAAVPFSQGQAREMFLQSETFDQLERPDPSRYSAKELQRILDRFGKGRIQALEDHRPNFLITTEQGRLLIHEEAGIPTQAELDEQEKRLAIIFGPLAPLAFRKEGGLQARLIHQNDRYYMAYDLV